MKSRILEKGTELFFRYGVKTVTMDAIASELGISKKTIYQHFPDKDSMVYEVVKNFVELGCSEMGGARSAVFKCDRKDV